VQTLKISFRVNVIYTYLRLCLRVGFWRGFVMCILPLFGSFKKIGKGFGDFEGFICPILKFPQIGGFGG